jgi:hypothetical protein
MRWAGLAACVLLMAACGEDPGSSATAPTPSPSAPPVYTVPSLLTADASPLPAGTNPLVDAARNLAAAGSFRIRISGSFGAPDGRRASIIGTGESQSATRYHATVTILGGKQTITSEILSYDGVNYMRSQTGRWTVTTASTRNSDPRGYAAVAEAAANPTDAGPAPYNGATAEHFTAQVVVSGQPATLDAYVDLAQHRLVGERIGTAGTAASNSGSVTVDFTDFGANINLVPPTVATP